MFYEKIVGWFSDEEAAALFDLVAKTEGPILEIGHFYGRSTACICKSLQVNNKKNKFISYDLAFATLDEVNQFFSKFEEYSGSVPELYYESFNKKTTTTELAKLNLKKFNLDTHVELVSGNFINVDKEKYSLIFADVTHSIDEIRTNLPHIIDRSLDKCTWAFHDMNPELIDFVTKSANCKFLFLAGSLGIFQFLGPKNTL